MEFNLPIEAGISGVTATPITDTDARQLIAAQGANVHTHITDLIVTNASTTADVGVALFNGDTMMAVFAAPKNGGGIAHQFKTPLRGAANTAWSLSCSGSAEVYATISGFKNSR